MEPIEYLEFQIRIEQGRAGEYPVTATSAAGHAQEMMRLPFDPQALEREIEALRSALHPAPGGRRKKEPEPQQEAEAFGQALFDALFRGDVRALYHTSRYQAAEEGKLLRIELTIEPQELASLPWESLYDPQLAEYLCQSTPLVRYIALLETDLAPVTTPPLRILGMIVYPDGEGAPAAEDEKRQLEEATSHLQALELVEVEWVEGQSARDLVQALGGKEWHVFHLIGDGGLDRNTGEGFVIMDDDAGQNRRLSATQLRWLLSKCESLRVVWLGAGAGVRDDRPDRFTSTAALLVQKGISAVLSAQLGANSPATEAFTEALYAALSASMPLDLAVAKGRAAIQVEQGDSPPWGAPVLHTHSPGLQLFERQAVMDTAQRRGDEALSGDDFSRALTQYTLAVEMGAEADVREQRDLAKAASRAVEAAEAALTEPDAAIEPQTDAVVKAIGDLEKLQEKLPGSPVVQSLLPRLRDELPGLRDRLWNEGQDLLETKTLGLTLEQRCRRMEDCVRLFEKARRLSSQANPSLEEDLAKARRRLEYLQNAQAQAKAERGKRLLIVGFIVVFVIAALIALYFVLQMIPLSDLFGRAPTKVPTVAAAATATLTEAVASTGATATMAATAVVPTATTAATTGGETAAAATSTATEAAPTPSPTTTEGATATRTASPVATDAPTATAPPPTDTAVPTNTTEAPPASQPDPTVTPTPLPTETPTAGIVYPAPAPVSPSNYSFLSPSGGTDYSLRWTWDGILQTGEWFDVRIWQDDSPHYGIAWTKAPIFNFDICEFVSGTYNWSIAVVRGEDAVWLGDLSPEAPSRQFAVSRSDLWCSLRGY